jgi:hypothetical protein
MKGNLTSSLRYSVSAATSLSSSFPLPSFIGLLSFSLFIYFFKNSSRHGYMKQDTGISVSVRVYVSVACLSNMIEVFQCRNMHLL